MNLIDKLFFPKMEKSKLNRRKDRIFEIIFEADTYHGKLFDVILLFFIMISVALVMLESVPMINAKHHRLLVILEWIVTGIFTIEYGFRLYCVRKPWRYFFSFYGIIDLLSILPTYLGIIYPHTKYLSSIRILRLFRVFRIFGLTQFNRGGYTMLIALRKSRAKIVVFLAFVVLIVVVIGSMMYAIEGSHPESGFTSIPASIYWAIVTLTTVGYGDVAPVTGIGKFLAAVVMIIGYGVIAVPTGIVSSEVMRASKNEPDRNTQVCQHCHDSNHELGANFCKTCGTALN